MIRFLVLLAMFGVMSDAYAGVAGRIAAAQALRAAKAKKTVVSVAVLLQLRAVSENIKLAENQDDAMPDYRKRRNSGVSDTDISRRGRGDTVGSRSPSTRRDSWEKPTSVFDERNTVERRGNAP